MFAAFNARLLSPFHAPEHWGDNSYELSEPVFMRAELDRSLSIIVLKYGFVLVLFRCGE